MEGRPIIREATLEQFKKTPNFAAGMNMQYVLERRLARCRRDLTDIAMRHRSIGEIAIAAGFKDLSHFSRAFRESVGRTPSDYRAASET